MTSMFGIFFVVQQVEQGFALQWIVQAFAQFGVQLSERGIGLDAMGQAAQQRLAVCVSRL
ncbi:hypothetical protein D3C84_1146950 [compost metagenome]